MYPWVFQTLQKTSICNYSLQECQELFGGNKLYLCDWLLVTVGRKDGMKHVVFLQITSYEIPLRGCHTLQLFLPNSQQIAFHVESLSYFRQHILKFTDRLSFERSTFIVHREKEILIRLKCVRSYFQQYMPRDKNVKEKEKEKKQLSFRTKTQFIKNLEQIFTSYTRDLGETMSKEEINIQIQQDLIDYFSKN
jgi:hypothetical protein